MRQLGLAWVQYAQDYDELTVPYRAGGAGSQAFFWAGILNNGYIKSAGMFHCPDTTPAITNPLTYSLNTAMAGTPTFGLSLIVSPAIAPIFLENFGTSQSGANAVDANGGMWIGVYGIPFSGSGSQACARGMEPPGTGSGTGDAGAAVNGGIHSGGSNYVFADGHVAWKRCNTVGTGFYNNTGCVAITPTPAQLMGPAYLGMDYNGDGIAGGDPNAVANQYN
jgi:prepilin-type processing-associated H-X9-DG protein